MHRTGTRDHWLRVVVPDLEAHERFVKQMLTGLEGIASIESGFALEQVTVSDSWRGIALFHR